MGRGIAAASALAGYPTSLFESDAGRRAGLRAEIEGSWERAVGRGKLVFRGRPRRRTELLDVPERLGRRRRSRPRPRGRCPKTWRSSGGSSPSSTASARTPLGSLRTPRRSRSRRSPPPRATPERVVGLHFFNPVAVDAPGRGRPRPFRPRRPSSIAPRRSPSSLGKQAIRVADAPGFATSRLGVALGLEAMRMVEEGVASAARHRPGHGARLRAPDGASQDERPGRPRREARDRRDARRGARRAALRASGDPAPPGRGGQDREEVGRGLLPVGGRHRSGPPEAAASLRRTRGRAATDRRGVGLGVVLCGVGLYALLSRSLGLRGPAPVLLLLGAVFFTLSALARFRGPLLPAGVLLGLGAGFLLRGPLAPWLAPWASILLGLGAGFLLVAAIDRACGRRRQPPPVVPGLVLRESPARRGAVRRLFRTGCFRARRAALAFRDSGDRAVPRASAALSRRGAPDRR